MLENVTVNGVVYAPVATGNRCVVVVDRGWVYAGDVKDYVDANGRPRIRIDRALWLFRWESIGFDGVLANPKNSKATIKSLAHAVDLPADAEIFRVPVAENWGL